MWFELSKHKLYKHSSVKCDPIITLFSEFRLEANYLFSLSFFNIMKYHLKLDNLTAAKGQILVAHKIKLSFMYQSITAKHFMMPYLN